MNKLEEIYRQERDEMQLVNLYLTCMLLLCIVQATK